MLRINGLLVFCILSFKGFSQNSKIKSIEIQGNKNSKTFLHPSNFENRYENRLLESRYSNSHKVGANSINHPLEYLNRFVLKPQKTENNHFETKPRLKIFPHDFEKSNNGVTSNITKIQNSKNKAIILESGIYKMVLVKWFSTYNWNKNSRIKFEAVRTFWKSIWFEVFIVLTILLMVSVFLIDRIRIEKEKRIGIEIKLMSLQSQMNPHFIYNSLSSLQKFIITHNDEQAMLYLSKFTFLMRRCYEYANINFISIEEEIDFLESYLQMELSRFNKIFKYEIFVSNDLEKKYQIPPLVLQPIVENCLKHGIDERISQGLIKISFKHIDHLMQVTISDNGIGVQHHNSANTTSSLFRLKDRLLLFKKMYKNQEIGISYHSTAHKGTTVILKLPLLIPDS